VADLNEEEPRMTATIRDTATTAVLGALALAAAAPLRAQTAVSPADRSNVEGGTSTTFPLGRFDARMQHLHADVDLTLSTIHGHAYRRDAIATAGRVEAFQTELEVQLSLAARAPSAASRTFADNRGAQPVTVLPRGWVSFPATDRPGTDPAPTFELRIPYATPFQRSSPGNPLCVEVVVYANQLAAGPNRNFTPNIDAHESRADGTNEQPGYRYGTGCPAPGQTNPHTGRLDFTRTPTDLVLTIASRDGVPSGATPASTLLIAGTRAMTTTFPWLQGCTLYQDLGVVAELPGPNLANGDWDGTITGLGHLPAWVRVRAQLASAELTSGALTLSDATVLTVPGLGPTPIPACRIVAGSDHTLTVGTVSGAAPVTQFF
jgi:hypothetical protein